MNKKELNLNRYNEMLINRELNKPGDLIIYNQALDLLRNDLQWKWIHFSIMKDIARYLKTQHILFGEKHDFEAVDLSRVSEYQYHKWTRFNPYFDFYGLGVEESEPDPFLFTLELGDLLFDLRVGFYYSHFIFDVQWFLPHDYIRFFDTHLELGIINLGDRDQSELHEIYDLCKALDRNIIGQRRIHEADGVSLSNLEEIIKNIPTSIYQINSEYYKCVSEETQKTIQNAMACIKKMAEEIITDIDTSEQIELDEEQIWYDDGSA